MLRKVISLGCIIFLSSGCTLYHIDAQGISTETLHPPKNSAADVEYIEHASLPHEIVGTITVNAERGQSFEQLIERMKKEAAWLGGDAITDIRSEATNPWKKLPGQKVIGNGYLRANFTASVIVFKQDSH